VQSPVNILVFNCGSSSLTYKLYTISGLESLQVILSGKAHRVGVKGTKPSFIEHHYNAEMKKDTRHIRNHREAADLVLDFVEGQQLSIDLVGHRFVHGGHHFDRATLINERTREKLQLCLPLAPIHNPMSLEVIQECETRLPAAQQYVTFDTAFHSTLPDHAYTYALPKSIRERFAFRKYGFHGLSYSYVTQAASDFLDTPLTDLKIIACHLGTGGSSVAAIKGGCSTDTSMGYSPLPGLIMSTRCGDIDPTLALYLMAVYGCRPEEVEKAFNKMSGLLGVSGISSDIRDLVQFLTDYPDEGEQAQLALNMYTRRLKKYVGSYVLALQGLDLLIFTDDIGVQNPFIRERICEEMEWCGLALDREKNQGATPDTLCDLTHKDSAVRVLSIPNDEEIVICREGVRLAAGGNHAFAN